MEEPITSKSQIRRMEAQGGDAAHHLLEQVWKLEAENKQLNEFIGQAFCADALPDWREYSALIKELVELRAENKELISRLKSREQFVLDHEECDKKMEKMRGKNKSLCDVASAAMRLELMERDRSFSYSQLMASWDNLREKLAALSTPSPDSTEGL